MASNYLNAGSPVTCMGRRTHAGHNWNPCGSLGYAKFSRITVSSPNFPTLTSFHCGKRTR